MAELGCDEVLHEAGSNSVHICGALVQTHDARPPQKHARQAQQLLLPCAPAQPRTLNLTHPSTRLFKTQGTPPRLEAVPLQPDPSVIHSSSFGCSEFLLSRSSKDRVFLS